jgi:(2R)-sulfolactate sulfo-lyase subunit beta
MVNGSFHGYARQDGTAGVRNHVVVLPVDDISNAAAEAVGRTVMGPLPLPHPYGRLQFGEDLDLFFRTMVGTGRNPNVAAAVVIGIEPAWTDRIADGIASTGKPVERFSIEGRGDIRTIAAAAQATKDLVQDASEIRREEIPLERLIVGIKCGESDTTSGLGSNRALGVLVDRLVDAGATVLFGETTELTGAEQLIAQRCADDTIRARFQGAFDRYAQLIAEKGRDLLGSQPSKGNIKGGLSTIEEKAFGNVQKTGTRLVGEALDPAQPPTRRGLAFMDTSSAGAECVTLMAAAGAAVHLFTTGQGNVIGNPIIPVMKLCANPHTVRSMAEHIDVDLSRVLTERQPLEAAADEIESMLRRVLDGRHTSAEALGHREFVLTRLHAAA